MTSHVILEHINQAIDIGKNSLQIVDSVRKKNGIFINDLDQITGLNVSGYKIKDFSFLSYLPHLLELDISENRLGYIPFLKHVPKLKYLNASHNTIFDLTPLKHCDQLTDLNLSWNLQIYDISPLKSLSKLRFLDLSRNHLRDISPLKSIFSLKKLLLYGNSIAEAECLAELTRLTNLDLGQNRLTSLYWLANLIELRTLNVYRNRITDLQPVHYCGQLQELNASLNRLREVHLNKKLSSLRKLDLSLNDIEDINFLSQIPNLEELNLSHNFITSIAVLQYIKTLKKVFLSHNVMKSVGSWICSNPAMGVFGKYPGPFDEIEDGYYFENNPLLSWPPMYVVQGGKSSMKSWYDAAEKGSVKNRYTKLIVAGNSGVGKTTLINFLLNEEYKSTISSTHGIKLTNWSPQTTNLLVSVWDFGGQEYYHATHRLFFTDDATYLLLWNKSTNKEVNLDSFEVETDLSNQRAFENHSYEYWLSLIRYYARKSSILMIQTKTDEESVEKVPAEIIFLGSQELEKEIKTYHISTKFAALGMARSSSRYNKFAEEFHLLRKDIKSVLQEAIKPPEIPFMWDRVREKLELTKEYLPYISFQEFITVCDSVDTMITENILDPSAQIHTLMLFLSKSGVIIHFKGNKFLDDVIFLDPVYLTERIYSILNLDVKRNNGLFSKSHVAEIVGNDENAKLFIELMKAPRFELIFPVPGKQETYIAPQYLPLSPPVNHVEYQMLVEPLIRIVFVFKINDIHLSHFMLRLLSYYGENSLFKIYWRNGMLISKSGVKLLFLCDTYLGTVMVKTDESSSFSAPVQEIFKRLVELCKDTTGSEFSYDNENFLPLKFWFELLEQRKKTYQSEHNKTEIPLDYFYFLNDIGVYSAEVSQDDLDNLHGLLIALREKKDDIKQRYNHETVPANRYALSIELSQLETQIRNALVDLAYLHELPNSTNSVKYSLENITMVVEETNQNLKEIKKDLGVQTDILKHFTSESAFVAEKLRTFTLAQKLEINRLINTVNEQEMEDNQHTNTLASEFIAEVIKLLKQSDINERDTILAKLNHKGVAANKIKLSIPIIPLILNYEKELGWEFSINIKSWKNLIPWLKKKRAK